MDHKRCVSYGMTVWTIKWTTLNSKDLINHDIYWLFVFRYQQTAFLASSNTAFSVVNWCCINISSRKVYFLDFWKNKRSDLDKNHIEPSKMLENDIFIQKRGKITPSKIKQKLNWDKNRNYENVLVIIFNLSTNLALIQSYSHHPRVVPIFQILPWRIPSLSASEKEHIPI